MSPKRLKREVLTVTPRGVKEPKIMRLALINLASEKLTKTMEEEEVKSTRTSQV